MNNIFVSIIVPYYKKSKYIDKTISSILQQTYKNFEIIIIDDGSTDGCLELLEEHDKLMILSLPHCGKGSAVTKGMLIAAGDIIVFSDIDWSVPVEQVLCMLSSSFDILIASREIVGARRIAEPPWRHLLGKTFNRWVQWMLISGYEDTQCGCKIFSKAAAKAIFAKVEEKGWAFDVEVLVIAHVLGFQVKEYPVSWHYQANSKIQLFRDGTKMARAVLRIKKRLLSNSYL